MKSSRNSVGFCLGLVAVVLACAVSSVRAEDLNARVLQQIREMPSGGGYMPGGTAMERLKAAVSVSGAELLIRPSEATPSFCSSATYLVLLKTIESLANDHKFRLDAGSASALSVRGQRDGEGIWGRWNANGPGTARLFHELQLGPNFLAWDQARPGDFMKIFWTQEIGKAERGHSVVFLGTEERDGQEYVRFWSSNTGMGYGEKAVPRSKVALAVFSRLQTPENLVKYAGMPGLDPYLSSLLTKRSSFSELKEKCGL